MMTIANVKRILALHGLTIRKTHYGEFRVNFRNGAEESAYYAADLEDALETGLAMVRNMKGY